MTAGAGQETVPLRQRLKAMAADVDNAGEAHLAHLGKHGCRGRCKKARELGDVVADAQYQLGVTRFLNEGD